MLCPIPENLRPDDMTVREPINGDYGGEYGEPYVISNVRFDSNSPLVRGYILEVDSQGVVFVDGTSNGAREVPTGSLVTIRGNEMAVVKSRRYEDFGGHVHHWELEVK